MEINSAAQAEFELFQETERERAENAIHRVRLALEACESPVEQTLLIQMISVWYGEALHSEPGDSARFKILFPDERTNGFRLSLVQQEQVDIPARFKAEKDRKYRVDFAVYVEHVSNPSVIWRGYAIEVDGHEFHEKTKEQARRDRSRERSLMSSGFGVIRFTGSEVHRDASACVLSAEQVILRGIAELRLQAGLD